jgi:hypothetical protein
MREYGVHELFFPGLAWYARARTLAHRATVAAVPAPRRPKAERFGRAQLFLWSVAVRNHSDPPEGLVRTEASRLPGGERCSFPCGRPRDWAASFCSRAWRYKHVFVQLSRRHAERLGANGQFRPISMSGSRYALGAVTECAAEMRYIVQVPRAACFPALQLDAEGPLALDADGLIAFFQNRSPLRGTTQ